MQETGTPQHKELRRALAVVAVITAALLLLGLSLDMATALGGNFFSDCATYYALATSMAGDLDIEYHRSDIQRVYADFSGGPAGIFLQRNPESGRLFYGKAYIYPAFLAIPVRLLGVRGVPAGHALLFGAVILGFTLLWERRWGALRALALGLALVLPSVATVYYFWIAPEFFNFTIIFAACFLWLHKSVNPLADGEEPPPWRSALLGGWTDIAAAALYGVATYSKTSNGVLVLPLLAFLLLRRRWKRLPAAGAAFAVAVGLLFGIQAAVTGNWNYQGGERKSFHQEFPYANGKSFDTAGGARMETNVGEYSPPFYPLDIAHNLIYFFIGRFGGIVPYYFPAALILVLFLARGRSGLHNWLVLGGACLAALTYIVLIPTNVIGGGGTVGNRYFMNILPFFLVLLPERAPRWTAAAAVLGGVLFAGHILITPITTSQYPGRYAETPFLAALPVEYTMLNDLPIRTESERTRVPWYVVRDGRVVRAQDGPVIAFYLYQVDHNTFLKEIDAGARQFIWTRGGRRAEMIIRAGTPDKPLRRISIRVSNSPCGNDVTITVQGQSRQARMEPGGAKTLVFDLAPGFAYHYFSTSYLYPVVVTTSCGVAPRTKPEGLNDFRHLGVMLEFEVE